MVCNDCNDMKAAVTIILCKQTISNKKLCTNILKSKNPYVICNLRMTNEAWTTGLYGIFGKRYTVYAIRYVYTVTYAIYSISWHTSVLVTGAGVGVRMPFLPRYATVCLFGIALAWSGVMALSGTSNICREKWSYGSILVSSGPSQQHDTYYAHSTRYRLLWYVITYEVSLK